MLVSGVLTLENGALNHLWFLPAMAILYLLLPLFCALQREDVRLFNTLCAIVLVLVFGDDFLSRAMDIVGLISGSQIPENLLYFIDQFNPLRGIYGHALAYCLAGMWLSGKELLVREKLASLLHLQGRGRLCQLAIFIGIFIGPIVLACFTEVRFAAGQSYDPTWGGYSFLGTFLTVICLYLLLFRVFGLRKGRISFDGLFTLLGRNTLAIYLFHWPIVHVFDGLHPFSGSPLVRLVVGLLICFAICLASAAVGEWVRKTKLGNWLLSV